MKREPEKLLYDIAEACAAIRAFVRGRTREEYASDLMLRSACERQFEIVGEAMTRLRDSSRDVFDRVPDGGDIIAFRNRLIHGYDTVDTDIVWAIVQRKLPALEESTRRLLAE